MERNKLRLCQRLLRSHRQTAVCYGSLCSLQLLSGLQTSDKSQQNLSAYSKPFTSHHEADIGQDTTETQLLLKPMRSFHEHMRDKVLLCPNGQKQLHIKLFSCTYSDDPIITAPKILIIPIPYPSSQLAPVRRNLSNFPMMNHNGFFLIDGRD